MGTVVYFRPYHHIPVALCGKHHFKIPAKISSADMGVFPAVSTPSSNALARTRTVAFTRQNGHRATFRLGMGLDLPVQDGNDYFRLYACGRFLYPFAQSVSPTALDFTLYSKIEISERRCFLTIKIVRRSKW